MSDKSQSVDTVMEDALNCISFTANYCEFKVSLNKDQDCSKLEVICDILCNGAEIDVLEIEGHEKDPCFSLKKREVLEDLSRALSTNLTLISLTFSKNSIEII